jgi:acyl-CoA thioester hydrolase
MDSPRKLGDSPHYESVIMQYLLASCQKGIAEQRMMESQLTHLGAVYPRHCDHIGHMNVMWYSGKFDEASWNFLQQLGISSSYIREEMRGMVAVEQATQFIQELLAGDTVSVRSQVLEVRERVIRIVHTMRNTVTQEPVAICTITAVHVDRRTRKSCPFPALIRDAAMRLTGLRHAERSAAAQPVRECKEDV